jgi:hypothetical protein
MARMLPAEPRTTTRSELEIFHAIRNGLSDDWTAIHSLGMTRHPDKPWTEIDFVLIGPEGLFCLEVKGGIEILREGTRWLYRDGRGRTVTRNESPFEQVGGAAAALRKYLIGVDGQYRSMLSGFGVATPFVDFTATGPDLLPEVVYDAGDTATPFAVFMDRLSTYWQDRIGRYGGGLSANGRARLIRVLAGDFQLVRGLSGLVEDIDETLIRLTDEQQRALEGVMNDRLLVRGGAGTGKTVLALRAAARAAEMGERTLLTCFSRRLGGWLEEQAGEVENLTVISWHRFMRRLLQDTNRLQALPPADEHHVMAVEFPRESMEAMLELGITGSYDRLVVDEAQDLLMPGYLDVFDQLLDGGLLRGRWAMFYDPNQDLFGGLVGGGMARIREGNPAVYQLSTNCRNTRQIAYEAGMLAGFEPSETLEANGPDVDEIWCRDDGEQRRVVSRAINRLLSDGIQPSQITILSQRRLQRSCLAAGLDGVPFALTDQPVRGDNRIAYSTTQAFKGLESDVVLIVDVDGLSSPEDRYSLYVATTRARAHLIVALGEALRGDHEAAAQEFGRIVGEGLRRRK